MEGITIAHLRQRARHYRTLSDKEGDPARSVLCREIADVLDREADAIRDDEAKQMRGTPKNPSCRRD